jgi:hypothetical protein
MMDCGYEYTIGPITKIVLFGFVIYTLAIVHARAS